MLHHSVIPKLRWATTATGYLRVYQNRMFADEVEQGVLVKICSFIVDVYTPFWMVVIVRPRCPDGPGNILFANRLLTKHGNQDIITHVKLYFDKHALTWLSPKNVALSCYSRHEPPMTPDEVSRVCTRQVDAQRNLSRMKPLKAYFTIESQCAPCLSIGNEDHWNSVDNHNRTCERHIGLMKDIISKGKIVDDPSNLELSDQRIRKQICLRNIKKFEEGEEESDEEVEYVSDEEEDESDDEEEEEEET